MLNLEKILYQWLCGFGGLVCVMIWRLQWLSQLFTRTGIEDSICNFVVTFWWFWKKL